MSSPRAPVAVAPVAVALDTEDLGIAQGWAAAVGPHVSTVKVGLELFLRHGADAVRTTREASGGRAVFLDLKLHDIPTTVGRACAVLSTSGARYVNVHAAGGAAMVRAAAEGLDGMLTLLAVTVLTSEADPPPGLVEERAALALAAGAGGLVCGAPDLPVLRSRFPDAVLLVPGTRPAGADRHDQGRTATPAEALDAGADLVVLGRPVTAAQDPPEALRALVDDLAGLRS